MRLVGCDAVEPEVEIVCETYDLIRRHYVDEIWMPSWPGQPPAAWKL